MSVRYVSDEGRSNESKRTTIHLIRDVDKPYKLTFRALLY